MTPTVEELLDFEAAHPKHTGVKAAAIERRFGISPARYYVLLGRAARSLEGMRYDAITARLARE